MRQVYRKKTEAQPPPEAVELREKTMNAKMLCSILGVASFGLAASAQAETTLTIATVNNPDMIVMQKYSTKFEAQTGIKLKWLVLEENVLRQRVTTDISTNGGQFDIITIGLFETPLWGKAGWLAPFDNLSASYDLPDVLQTVRNSLSYEGKLYSLPFYAESAMTYYRTDVFKKAGLTMPEKPTWDQIAEFADKVNDPAHGVYGVCLRGQPGWGENMGLLGVVANAFGGQLFDVNWKSGYTDDGWRCSRAAIAPSGSMPRWRRAFCTIPSARRWRTRSRSPRCRPKSPAGSMAGSGPGRWAFRNPASRSTRPRSSSNGRRRRTTSR
jgi:ABC-type glycerol-3-phosphate transport system substrate-binding protein